jgi:hypothetical protein
MHTACARYQHSDHLGGSHLETEEHGAVISYEEYHPFGTTAYQATLNLLPFGAKRYRYCGKERDEESGLYYYGARCYAAWLWGQGKKLGCIHTSTNSSMTHPTEMPKLHRLR